MADNDVTAPHVMACMEVWGGNRAIDNGVVMPGLDAWVYSLPFQSTGPDDGGGDIHYVTSCATGRITRLIVADVSGHGAPVARAADALRRLMRRHSNYIDQSRLVEAVNREFNEIGEDALGEGGAMFATAVIATYFAPTDELAISNAGHPRPLRFDARAKRWGRVEAPEGGRAGPSNLPLGVLEETRYPASLTSLRPNDLVLFYTDSLIETKDAHGRLLGTDGLIDHLNRLDPARPETLVRGLLAAIGHAEDGSPIEFDDDVTALLIRRNALKPRPSLGLAMLSGWRILREAVRSILPGRPPASFPELTMRSIGGAMNRALNGRGPEGSGHV
ncbi:MAG TPA: PP2C family protein-serine/threonine phosphatase [Phycisphaerales bacterium]|mgnify:CR=1 FL=1|nr:PP2C family protein-serine/threonine phosphatase [Phycisphaerales bacterium]